MRIYVVMKQEHVNQLLSTGSYSGACTLEFEFEHHWVDAIYKNRDAALERARKIVIDGGTDYIRNNPLITWLDKKQKYPKIKVPPIFLIDDDKHDGLNKFSAYTVLGENDEEIISSWVEEWEVKNHGTETVGIVKGENADIAGIIRCQDCAHNLNPETFGNANCELLYGMADQTGFCHLAERREKDE